jgi:hypothetical protein
MQVQSHTDHEFIGPLVPAAAPAAPQQTGRAGKRSRAHLHLGLSLWIIGFAAGFVFWQYVGFWGLIQSVFYPGSADRSGPERGVRASSEPSVMSPVAQSSGAPQSIGLLSVKLSAESCTSLLLNRAERAMVTAPCDSEVMPLNSLIAARKQDRRISVAEAKAATAASAAVPPVAQPAVPPTAKAKTAPVAPAVASWSATVLTNPAR